MARDDRTSAAAEAPASGIPLRHAVPLLIGASLNPLNSSILATALSPIGRAFPTVPQIGAWLIAGVYLSAAVAQPLLGRLADIFGVRRILLVGFVVAALGGLLADASSGATPLILARVLIGIGTSAGFPCAIAALGQQSRAAPRGLSRPTFMVLLSAVSTLAAALGPPIGGTLTQLAGWRSVFLINLPMGAVGIVLALLLMPADARTPDSRPGRLDIPGALLFAATISAALAFLMSLSKTPHFGLLPVALGAGMLFIRTERHAAEPFLDLDMVLGNPGLRRTYLRNCLCSLMLYVVFYGLPQWLQQVRGFQPAQAGLIMIPIAGLSVAGAVTVSRVSHPRVLRVGAVTSLVLAFAPLLLIDSGVPLPFIVAIVAMIGFATGAILMINQQSLVRHAPPAALGAAAGLFRTAQYLGAIAAAVVVGDVLVPVASDAALREVAWLLVPAGVWLGVLIALGKGKGARDQVM